MESFMNWMAEKREITRWKILRAGIGGAFLGALGMLAWSLLAAVV